MSEILESYFLEDYKTIREKNRELEEEVLRLKNDLAGYKDCEYIRVINQPRTKAEVVDLHKCVPAVRYQVRSVGEAFGHSDSETDKLTIEDLKEWIGFDDDVLVAKALEIECGGWYRTLCSKEEKTYTTLLEVTSPKAEVAQYLYDFTGTLTLLEDPKTVDDADNKWFPASYEGELIPMVANEIRKVLEKQMNKLIKKQKEESESSDE